MADSKLTSWKSVGWPCDWRNVKEAKGTVLMEIMWNLPRYARDAAYFSGEIYQGGGPLYQGFKDYCRSVKDYFYQSAKDADAYNKPNLLKYVNEACDLIDKLLSWVEGRLNPYRNDEGQLCHDVPCSFDELASKWDTLVRKFDIMEQFFIRKAPRKNVRNRKSSKGDNMHSPRTFWKKPSTNDIWNDIYEDFEVKKLTFAKKINFVTDTYKRKTIFRDIEHAYLLAKNNFSKSAVILTGSVIEELLRLYLETKKVKPAKKSFEEYIKICEQKKLLKSGISRLSDSVRHFRNLVHLEREKTQKHKTSKATAKSAVASIFIVSNDF